MKLLKICLLLLICKPLNNLIESRIIKVRRTKNDSILKGFFPGDENTRFIHNLASVKRIRKFDLNPLSMQLGMHRYDECIY